MGGKPNSGTKADKRLKENKTATNSKGGKGKGAAGQPPGAFKDQAFSPKAAKKAVPAGSVKRGKSVMPKPGRK